MPMLCAQCPVENVLKALWSQFQAWYDNSTPAGIAGKQKAE